MTVPTQNNEPYRNDSLQPVGNTIKEVEQILLGKTAISGMRTNELEALTAQDKLRKARAQVANASSYRQVTLERLDEAHNQGEYNLNNPNYIVLADEAHQSASQLVGAGINLDDARAALTAIHAEMEQAASKTSDQRNEQ